MNGARSYVRTPGLEAVAQKDPVLAEQVETLCRAVMALRGLAIVYQAESSLRYAAAALEPFVTIVDAFDVAMAAKNTSKQCRMARSKRRKALAP